MAEAARHTDHGHGDPALERSTVAGLSQRRAQRLSLVLVFNAGIIVVEVVAGVIAHSLGLLADAGHNFTDVVAVALSLVAVQWSRRQSTDKHSYGYHRGTILAALANAASILAITLLIAYEGVQRLINPEPVEGSLVVIVAVAAALLNGGAAWLLREPHPVRAHHDLNMRSALLHMLADTFASIGVAVAGAVILITGGFYWLDPVISLGIGLLIGVQAFNLLRQAVNVLFESTPPDIDVDQLSAAVTAMPGIEAVHDVHVWSLSSELRALSAHLVLDGHPSLEEAQRVGNTVKDLLSERFGIAHATLELECEACDEPDPRCPVDSHHQALQRSPRG